MFRNLLLVLTLILASCSQQPESTLPPQHEITTQATLESVGELVKRHLNERYNDTAVNCGQPTQPAFLCSGIEIRGTHYSTAYHAWDNSINNHTKGAVSFSYLRKDSRYKGLAYGYDNGYIFLPAFYASGKLTPEVLCSFPIDAATEYRAGTGCGASPGIADSGPCQAQGITTAAQWYSHFISDTNRPRHQCGFDVQLALGAQATDSFNATLQAMALTGAEYFATHNELRLRVWPDGQGANLPLEAFFYLNGLAAGRADAQADQRDFKSTTGLTVPVISIHLPSVLGQEATFDYLPSDQAIPMN